MGQLPRIFTGDRTQADDFIDELKGYLRLNHRVTGFDSPITKVALALTLIKGPEVAGWVRDVGEWLDTWDPNTQNIPAIWNIFLQEFARQFQDTQRPNRARIELEKLTMKPGEIDQYISRFEELARQAQYTAGDEATTTLFLKGLPAGILVDIFKPPAVTTYEDIKERAIQSTKSRILIDSILGSRRSGQTTRPINRGGFRGGAFQSFQSNTPRPTQTQNNFQRDLPGPPRNNNPINSSNAPRWMNNTAVPMDLSRARAPTWRGQGQRGGRAFGRLAQMNGGRNTSCFNCGREGHFARDCRSAPRRPQANSSYTMEDLISFDDAYSLASDVTHVEQPQDHIAAMKAQLNAMSSEDKTKLAQELAAGDEDFPSA